MPNKMKVLFATLAVSVTAHSVKLVKPQLNFDELAEALGGQRALLGAKYGASSEPVVNYYYQNAQQMIHNNLLWIRQVRRLTCDLRITFSTTKANQARMSPLATHSRSSTDPVQCQVFYSMNTMNIGGMSIADYTLADVPDVSEQNNINA